MFVKLIEQFEIPEGITHIAGPPKSGKTTILYHLFKGLKADEKAIIVDSEIVFNAHRLQEITSSHSINFDNILVLRTENGFEQFKIIMNLHSFIQGVKTAFIAVNGITNYFRKKFVNDSYSNLYHLVALQVAYLKYLSMVFKIPIILTNQVSGKKTGKERTMKAVAGNILNFYSDISLIINNVDNNIWKVVDDKGREIYYTITSKGISVIK
ncbi:MAG: hypothetical protein ACTSQE_02135 [Candidatus Heimdallarchaeaceae archaeon]